MAGEGSVQVLVKAGALLECLAHEELTAAGLAERTGEPRSTVYRLLTTLQRLGYTEVDPSRGTWRLGVQLLRLGGAVQARFDERRAAHPVMERLAERTGETVFLCVRRGAEAVCIERIDGRRVRLLALQLGGTLPMHAGAVSRALLAFGPREGWDEIVAAGPLRRFTSATPRTGAQLFALLEETRRTGVAISDEDVTEGIAAIGAPIFGFGGGLRAAISVAGVRPAILGERAEEVQRLVVEAAREVSATLGADLAVAAVGVDG